MFTSRFFQIVIFMSEATILTVNKQFCGQLNRHQNFIVHSILVSFGTVFILAGTFVIIWDRIVENEGILNHIHTITGITIIAFHPNINVNIPGIISIFCIITSLVLGILIVMLKHGIKPYILPVKDAILNWFELPHIIFGSLGYGIGMGSLCYGFALSTKFSAQVPFVVKSGCIVMCLIVAGWTMLCSFLALSNTLQRIVNSYEQPVGNISVINVRRSIEQKVQTSSDMQDISQFN